MRCKPKDEDEYDLVDHPTDGHRTVSTAKIRWTALFGFTAKADLLILMPALVCSCLAGALQPVMALIFGNFFDSFSEFGAGEIHDDELMQRGLFSVYALVALGFATWILKGGLFCLWVVFGEMQVKRVRGFLFSDFLTKDMAWFEMHRCGIGSLVVRLQTYMCDLQFATSHPFGFICTLVAQILMSTSVALYHSWKLTLVVFSASPITILIVYIVQRRMPAVLAAHGSSRSTAAKISHQAIANIVTVKCCNAQDYECTQYTKAVTLAAQNYRKQARINAIETGASRIVSTVVTIAGIYYGNFLVHSRQCTVQEIMTTFWSCIAAVGAIEDIFPQLLILERGRASASTLLSIADPSSPVEAIKRSRNGLCLNSVKGAIRFQDIVFAYPSRPHHPIICRSTLLFEAGKTTFLVGSSGSGKSTISHLLLKFYKPCDGNITLDGYDIEHLDTFWIRNNVALVQQQSTLFNETLFRNISFGKSCRAGVSKDMVQQCLAFAQLQDLEIQLPQGLETLIGSGGPALSGGQIQRIAIARSKLKDAPILVLDEPTSALDYRNRSRVINNVRRWRRGKTTIIVTHDLSQITEQDFCYILRDGHIAFQGYLRTSNARTRGKTLLNEIHRQPNKRETTALLKSFRSTSNPGSIGNELDTSFESLQHSSVDGLHTSGDPTRNYTECINKFAAVEPYILRTTSCLGWRASTGSKLRTNDVSRRSIILATESMSQDIGDSEPTVNRPHYAKISQQERTGMGSEDSVLSTTLSLRLILVTVVPALDQRERFTLMAGVLAATVHATCISVFSYCISRMFAIFYQPSNWQQSSRTFSLLIVGVGLVDGMACYLMHYLMESAGQRWIDRSRVKALTKVMQQSTQWFDKDSHNASLLTLILDRHAEEMRNLLGRFAGHVYLVTVMMLIATVWAFVKCWKLTCIAVACALVLYGITSAFGYTSSRWEARTNIQASIVATIFMEAVGKLRTVRALTIESYFHDKYNKATRSALATGIRRGMYCGFFFGLSDAAIHFATAGIFGYGAALARSGEYSVETLMTVFALLLFSTANAQSVVALIPQLSASVDAASKLLHLAHLSPTSHETIGTIDVDRDDPGLCSNPIRFLDETFSYPSRTDICALRNFDLTISPNAYTAIVGSSGSGKSTIASLLLALYPANPSSLLIANRDINTLTPHSLRSIIALVPQTPTLISGTIRANILYGNIPLHLQTDNNMHSAAMSAGIHTFILTLPSAYDTVIGDGGLGLSGGQAQRIVIARALVRRPRILILDEATSALDQQNAEIVRTSIRRLAGTRTGGMTVIVITHAKEMMECADHVIVMKNGTVVEQGMYRDLLLQRGELWDILSEGRA